MKYLLLIVFLTAAPLSRAASAPPPLTPEQITRIQKLIRTNRSTDERVKRELGRKQKLLTEAYAKYDLQDQAITSLQSEILGLQQQLLTNYHHLQVELRKTVGEQRFYLLKRRIDNYLKTSAAKNGGKETAKEGAAKTAR